MILYILALIGVTTVCAIVLSNPLDRGAVVLISLLQWIVYSLIISIMAPAYPFSAGGDDINYYLLAYEAGGERFSDVLNPFRYAGRLEQPGYGVVLSLAHNVFGADIDGLKFINLSMTVVTTIIYARIGTELGGRRFGILVAIFVAALTPLWYYFIFLLKDIFIVALQGATLLAAIQIYKSRGRHGWLLAVCSSALLIPFRSFLVVLNLSVISAASALIGSGDTTMRKAKGARWPSRSGSIRLNVRALSSILLCLLLFYVLTSPVLAQYLGIATESRMLRADTISMFAMSKFSSSIIERVLFPLLYLMSETSGVQTILSGVTPTVDRLRGLFAIPWIVFYLPLLLAGVWVLALSPQKRKLWSSPWIVVVVFCLAYLGVSWIVGDTTRWRLPDMPALTTISALGYSQISQLARGLLLSGWFVAVAVGAALFYLL